MWTQQQGQAEEGSNFDCSDKSAAIVQQKAHGNRRAVMRAEQQESRHERAGTRAQQWRAATRAWQQQQEHGSRKAEMR